MVRAFRIGGVLLPLFLLANGLVPACAQDMTMKGISQLQVDLAFIDGQGTGICAEKVLAKSFGVLEEPIRTETELRLREVGLRIGPGQVLRVTVSACASVANVNIELREWATVDVRGRRGIVTTWSEGGLLLGSSELRVTIRDLVSRFVNRWLADKSK
jgi:hypothetical protein